MKKRTYWITGMLVILLVLPSLSLVSATQTTQTVELTIQGGIGWYIHVYNHGSQEVWLNYDAEATGVFSGRTALDVHGHTNCPPDMGIGRKQTSILTTVPLARITVTVECEGQSQTRSGLMICSVFVIFLS